MAALQIEVANAVRDALKAHAFTEPCEVTRDWVPEYTPSQMDAVHVPVVPGAKSRTRASRGAWQITMEVQVGVMRRAADDAARDLMLGLTDEIEEFLADDDQARLTTDDSSSARFVGLTITYDQEALRQGNQFTAVLVCSYLVWEAS